jgi:hypothetical protein
MTGPTCFSCWWCSLAHALLTLLGKTGRGLGMERWLTATKSGGISLLRQGLLLYELIPIMQEEWHWVLLGRFDTILHRHVLFTGALGVH